MINSCRVKRRAEAVVLVADELLRRAQVAVL